jgi:2-oxopent-4-enoate/cis-2-oxohex-4-enoate hydratase
VSLPPAAIERVGQELFAAWRDRRVLLPLTDRYPAIDIDDAYRISMRVLAHHQAAGARVIGKKIGVTSQAVQDMLDVRQPDFGFLLDTMQLADGAMASMEHLRLIQPRAEGEIAFVLEHELRGPGITREQVLAATEYVCPCLEIVDSRIRDWKIKIQDTVADNASCGVFVLGGARTQPREQDLAATRMTIRKNGAVAAVGVGAAVQGHPATAVAWLANTLGHLGITLQGGEIIMSGSLGPLLPAAVGDRFELELEALGNASIAFSH